MLLIPVVTTAAPTGLTKTRPAPSPPTKTTTKCQGYKQKYEKARNMKENCLSELEAMEEDVASCRNELDDYKQKYELSPRSYQNLLNEYKKICQEIVLPGYDAGRNGKCPRFG